MKKIMYVCLCFALFSTLMLTASVQAINVGENAWFSVNVVNGPISVQVGNNLDLKIRITNEDYQVHHACKLIATVIDPFDGTRVLGPETFEPASCFAIAPGQHIEFPISLGPFESSSQDRTLGVFFLATSLNNDVRGTGGWGIVVE